MVSGERAETAYGLGVTPRGYGGPVLSFTDVDASGVGMTDLEGVGEHGGLRERRRRGWWRVKEEVFVGCHGSLREQDTDVREPWGRE